MIESPNLSTAAVSPATTLSVESLARVLPATARLMGVDPGTKNIGLAISDITRRIASPLTVIKRKKFQIDSDILLNLCKEHGICGLIIGLPINMNGSEGPRAQSTRAFARNLMQKTDLPITYWDERLSTRAVTRSLLEADVSRARRAELVDKMAAAYILQGALDRLFHISTS